MRARNSGMQSLVNNLVKGAFVVGTHMFLPKLWKFYNQKRTCFVPRNNAY